MQSKRILITAGGTGGHLYPAQALAQQLMKHSPASKVLFVAGGLSKNRYFDRQRFLYQEITSPPLLSSSPIKCIKGIKDLAKGINQSLKILREYNPEVVVGFGSYYTIPILLAAKWLRIPIILHEANSIPGRANRWLSSLATHVGIHFPLTANFFRKSIEVGLPLREGFHLQAMNKEEALAHYGFLNSRQTLLICGGSQGAQAINQLVEKCFPVLKNLSLQIIHSTGDESKAADLAALYQAHHIPACVKAFEPNMQIAWRAADAFVGRSGAATIAEAVEFEVPGILIPYPYATDRHQEKNADFLVETVKSGWKLLETGLTPEIFSQTIYHLFEENQYLGFKKALNIYKQRPHQLTLLQLVLNTIQKND